MTMPYRTLFGLFALVASMIIATGSTVYAGSKEGQSAKPMTYVSVMGEGKVYAEPDMAVLELGVRTTNEDVLAATEEVNQGVNKIISLLQEAGVAPEDIRTASFDIYPEERYDRDGNPTSLRYRVNNLLNITLRDTSVVGEVLSQSVAAGANDVRQISYTFSDSASLEEAARRAAVQNARAKAEQYADEAGVTLGSVRAIRERGTSTPYPVGIEERGAMMAAAPPGPVPVSAGQLAVQAMIEIEFTLE